MIPFDFEYYKPSTIKEAIDLFKSLDSQNKNPRYYSGGTEIITMSRINKVQTRALIDIKSIEECNILDRDNNSMVMGSALSLSEVGDRIIFPLLSKVIRTIADRTSRNKITLGGNICGKIPYKEAILPFFLSDSIVKIAGPSGDREMNINDFFNNDRKIRDGELVTQIITDTIYKDMPFYHSKKTRQSKVEYPLLSVSCIQEDSPIKIAISGMCNTPFRSKNMEDILNDSRMSLEDRLEKAIKSIEDPVVDNALGSSGYRKFVLKNIILESMEKLGGK